MASSDSPSSASSLSASTFQKPSSTHTPQKSYGRYCKGASTTTATLDADESMPDDYEVMVTKRTTKTITTTTTTTRRSATPQPQSMPNTALLQTPPSTPFCSKASKMPATPLSPRIPSACPSFAPSSRSSTPLSHAPFPTSPRFSPAPFPTSPHFSPTKRPTVPVFGCLWYHIPHPDTIVPPPYRDPPPKTWYAVTVGQDVGVFDDWLLVKELTDNVTGVRQKGYKTFDEALDRYHDKFFTSAVICRPHAGSRFSEPLPDWEEQEQEYEWGSEEEAAVCALEGSG